MVIRDYLKHSLRTGYEFTKMLDVLMDSEKYSLVQLQQIQNEKLRKIIVFARNNVSYYTKSLQVHNVLCENIKCVEDLHQLPIISKHTIKKNYSLFRSKGFRYPILKGYTSGTTGTPAVFLRDYQSINFENACIHLQQKWAGVSRNDKRIWLRGDRICSSNKNHPPFWRLNFAENQLVMSSYHLSKVFLPFYIKKIKEFAPKLLQAYPSTAYILAKYLESKNEYLDIPVIQTSSEPMFPHYREVIEARLRGKVFDYYGMAERVTIGLECEFHRGLHLIPLYGITEFINPATNEVSLDEGLIVGTTLNNLIMPLIRYKTDDYAKLIKESCPCGRPFPRIFPIETKLDDIIITKDGKFINPSLLTFCFKHSSNVELSQIIQREDSSICIKIVKGPNYALSNEVFIIDAMRSILGTKTLVTIEYVIDIPRTDNGKFRWVVSELKK